jgi:hypothetical protein
MVSVEPLSTEPIGPATRFRAEMKMRWRTVPMTIECTEYQRPRRLASATHLSSMDIEGALTFEPVAEGTRMRWQWELKPRGALKLMGPIIARIGERQEREIWTGLKRLLEDEAP